MPGRDALKAEDPDSFMPAYPRPGLKPAGHFNGSRKGGSPGRGGRQAGGGTTAPEDGDLRAPRHTTRREADRHGGQEGTLGMRRGHTERLPRKQGGFARRAGSGGTPRKAVALKRGDAPKAGCRNGVDAPKGRGPEAGGRPESTVPKRGGCPERPWPGSGGTPRRQGA
jgi:hypothetical protein